ncbi:hypothetical protein Q0Z83_037010 [Actinoplanes sichuanensis]|uniref:Vanadium-dependent haloperoxidase n=1 Tax=Actinoplanes sichuanensis TaxID=512349 RepID=A0ABW4A345_9ACTN|nr:vanadium-dependent haloperoxidase [Actinoplanes sichuanensis]BEL05510.1 hypothetical protein Q0Z83_037010 [Actinoplanes sichuanensis]
MRKQIRRALLGALATVLVPTGLAVTARPAQAAPVGDHVIFWNNVLLKTYRTAGGAPGPLARSGAMVHNAMFNAVNTINCHKTGTYDDFNCLAIDYTGFNPITNWANPDVETAIDYAAYTVLTSLYPNIGFSGDLAAAQDGIAVDAAQQQGRSVGAKAGQNMISNRDPLADQSGLTTAYTLVNEPGYWRPTGSGNAVTPNWGKVTPFSRYGEAYKSSFRPTPPGGYATMSSLLASGAYATQVNVVKSLGRATGSSRTADQTQAAWFWANDLDGTYKLPGQHFAHTQVVSAGRGLDQMANLRLFALVSAAMADAAVVASDANYQTPIDLWRPESAIQLAGTDNNAATTADATWKPLSADRNGVGFSPASPSWVSGHATVGSAWAETMKRYFGTDEITFTGGTDDPHAVGVTRTFTTLSAAAMENARSRIYLGVHYSWDVTQGYTAGTKVGTYVSNKLLQKVIGGGTYPTASECETKGDDFVYGNLIYSGYYCRGDSPTSWRLIFYPWM